MTDESLDLKLAGNGRTYSGLSAAIIRQWFAEGRLSRDDLVRPAGSARWMKLSLAPELCPPPVRGDGRLRPNAAASPPAAGRVTISPSQPAAKAADDDLGIPVPASARRRRRKKVPEDTELDMTPMIDVTFQLLIFFTLANQMANPAPIEVPLAHYGKGVSPEGKQSILLDAEGRYYLGEQAQPGTLTASLDELVTKVAEKASQSTDPTEVIISAHKKAQHRKVRELLERLSEVKSLGPIHLGVEEQQ